MAAFQIETIQTSKLLGDQLSSDLKRSSPILHVSKNSRKLLYSLKTLKCSGIPASDLRTKHYFFIRPILKNVLSGISLWVQRRKRRHPKSSHSFYIFILEIQQILRAFIAWWKPRRTFRRIAEQIRENQKHRLRVFTCSTIFTNFAEVFNRLWTCFISFIKLLPSGLKKRKTIYFIYTEIFASNFAVWKAFRILLRPIREAKRVSHTWKNCFVQSQPTV